MTLITRGPSQALVSPPTRSTPNRSASSRMPRRAPVPPGDRAESRQGDGHHGGAWNARHGRDVGKVHPQGLVADGLGPVLREPEMAAVHQHVGRDQEVGARVGQQDRAVVADAQLGPRARSAIARAGGSSRSGRIRRMGLGIYPCNFEVRWSSGADRTEKISEAVTHESCAAACRRETL